MKQKPNAVSNHFKVTVPMMRTQQKMTTMLSEILCEDIKEEKHRDLHKDEYEEIKNGVKCHLSKIKRIVE